MSLLNSLGLDKVESDPNNLPDGKYLGEVFKSEYLFHKGKGSQEKNTISHVITYRVATEDPSGRAGAQRQEWFEIGKDPVRDDEGKMVSITPTMTEQQKPWYKKRWEDLGIANPEEHEPEVLVGKKVTFGTKKNGNFININFVELREATDAPPATGSITGAL
jgi:hypothetical protein